MPIIQSAIKKLRKDRKREKTNDQKRSALKRAIKKAEKSKREDHVKAAISLIDKAAKSHLVHKNKAARLKSSLAKIVKIHSSKSQKAPTKQRTKKVKTITPTPLQSTKKHLH